MARRRPKMAQRRLHGVVGAAAKTRSGGLTDEVMGARTGGATMTGAATTGGATMTGCVTMEGPGATEGRRRGQETTEGEMTHAKNALTSWSVS
jgi:hypothetical protein